MTLALTSRLLSGCGKTTAFATFVNRLCDPVDTRITTNSLVLRINSDHFKVLVNTILVDPVGVEDSQVAALAANTFLSSGTERTLVLEVVDTLTNRLTVSGTLGDRLLAVTTSDTDTVNNVTLLGLVSETVGLVQTRRTRSTVDHVELTVFPASRIGEKR